MGTFGLVFDCKSFLEMPGMCLDGNGDLKRAVRRFTILLFCLKFFKCVLQFGSFLGRESSCVGLPMHYVMCFDQNYGQ